MTAAGNGGGACATGGGDAPFFTSSYVFRRTVVSHTIHVFDYLAAPKKHPPAAVCVVFGDELFLKQQALTELRTAVLGEEEAPYATFPGDTAEWRDVMDELATVALFGGGKRLVVVENADPFVTRQRGPLEKYVEQPRSSGVLVLDVKTWAGNTRLFKALDAKGLQIECRQPEKALGRNKVLDEQRLVRWVTDWAVRRHQVKLSAASARLMADLVGPEFGLLDQELAKLALFATPGTAVPPELVRDVVGGWRTKTIWDLLDAACEGKTAEALRELDRLLTAGEEPLALFGGMAWALRRFAAATRIVQRAERQRQKMPLQQALTQAGFRTWPKDALANAERQLKHLGRERGSQLYRWLLEADLALKGSHSTPHRARLVLEQMLLRLCTPAVPPRSRRA